MERKLTTIFASDVVGIAKNDGVMLDVVIFTVGTKVKHIETHRILQAINTSIRPGLAMDGINQVFVGIGRIAIADDLIRLKLRAVRQYDAGGLTLFYLYLRNGLIELDINTLL